MKRLLFVVVLTLCLSFPAFAGHTLPGYWCDCGTPGCICDPGEKPIGNSARPISDASADKSNLKLKANRSLELDFGSGALLIGLALFVWSRMRA